MSRYKFIKILVGLILILSLSILLNLSKTQAAESSEIVINEVEYDSLQSGTDTAYEWFELYNNTEEPIVLSGWTISDAYGTDIIPDLIIEPYDFAIIAATSYFTENYDPTDLNIVYLDDGKIGNGLSNTGDLLVLKDEIGQEVDRISYGSNTDGLNPSVPDVEAGHSIERCPAGEDTDSASDFIDQASPTPGEGILPNEPPVVEAGGNQTITLGQIVNFNSFF